MNTILMLLGMTFLPQFAQANLPCYGMSPLACEVFHLTNSAREAEGLPPLRYDPTCLSMAQEHSDDMHQRGYFSHQRPGSGDAPGETFSQRAARFGLSNGVAENIAINRGATQVVQAWLRSPGHRRNMLSPKYDSFGVGERQGKFTQVFWKSRN